MNTRFLFLVTLAAGAAVTLAMAQMASVQAARPDASAAIMVARTQEPKPPGPDRPKPPKHSDDELLTRFAAG